MPAADGRASFFEDALAPLDLTSRKTIILAISGGSDSTALLIGLRSFLDHHNPSVRILAVTVDHGLRPASAAEADMVARLCGSLGVEHRTMRWAASKPPTGISAAARAARYDLLALAADEAGSDLVLTGHTQDDLAETVAMRRLRGEGRGLAGIAPATLHRGKVWFARPLLAERRAVLQDFLRKEGVSWLTDPSNADRRFERARLRMDGPGDHDTLIAQATEAARVRIEQSKAAARLIEAHGQRTPDGGVRLDRDALHRQPGGLLALRLILATLGARTHLPDEARTSALLARLEGAEKLRDTLSGVVVELGRDGIRLSRERRRNASESPLAAGPFATLLPSFDIDAARALARLFGTAEPPPLPFAAIHANLA